MALFNCRKSMHGLNDPSLFFTNSKGALYGEFEGWIMSISNIFETSFSAASIFVG